MGHGTPDARVKLVVIARVKVVARQGAVKLDQVVLGEIVQVECQGVSGGGEVEVDGLLEGRVKGLGGVVEGEGDGFSKSGEVNVSAVAREIAVVGEDVEACAGGSTWGGGPRRPGRLAGVCVHTDVRRRDKSG